MRYILFILSILISQIAKAQTVTQPGLRDYQISGAALADSVLYILGTDTLDGSAKQGLGKFLTAESLRGFFKDTDWLRYRTGTIPTNTDTMYHVGVATVGEDSVYLSTNVLSGVLNVVGRLDLRFGEVQDYNIMIGRNAGRTAMTGLGNIGIGNSVLDAATSGANNIGIGAGALGAATTSGTNVAIGPNAGYNIVAGSNNNFFLGNNSGDILEGDDNVMIGAYTGNGGSSGISRNIFIGSNSGNAAQGTNNVFIGYETGLINQGTGNVLIGYQAGYNDDVSDKLYIENSDSSTPLIHGDFAADTLRINGDLSIRDAVSGASTDSVLVWTPSNGRVKMRNASAFGGSGSTDLTIGGSGPTYTIESSTGTDVTIAAAGINALSESPANTLVITATEVDGSITNEIQTLDASGTGPTITLDLSSDASDPTITGAGITAITATGNAITITSTEVDGSTTNEIQDITVTGASQPFTLDLGSDATDATFTGAGITTVTRSTNALTFTSTEVDGSTTNEAWTADADDADTEVISNQTVVMAGDTGIITDYIPASNTFSFDIKGDDFTTVTTAQSDDYLLIHDENGASGDVLEKMLWSDFTIDLITFYDGTSLQGTGNAIDVGEGLDINMVSTEANINLDASEFQVDGAADGTEYVLIHDTDTTAGHQIQRRLVSSFGGTDTHFGGDNLTWDANRTHDQSTFTTEIGGTNMTWKFQDNNATTGAQIILAGNVGDSDAPMGQIQFMYDDSGFATDQTAWTMVATRETDSQEHSTLEITANEAASAPPVATWEENENLSDNTQETSLRLNSGIAYTQYWESTGANAITLDRGYYNVALLTGHTGTITLPQIYGIDESNIEIDAAQVAIGQEYVITNLSGSSVTIAAYNPAAATNDDWLNGTEAGTYTLTTGNSVILKAVTIVSNEGHWFVYD